MDPARETKDMSAKIVEPDTQAASSADTEFPAEKTKDLPSATLPFKEEEERPSKLDGLVHIVKPASTWGSGLQIWQANKSFLDSKEHINEFHIVIGRMSTAKDNKFKLTVAGLRSFSLAELHDQSTVLHILKNAAGAQFRQR